MLPYKNNNNPTVKEIDESLFKATERYHLAVIKFNEKKKSKEAEAPRVLPESSNYAVEVKYKSDKKEVKFRPCSLCSEFATADHPIYKCSKYSSATEKVNRIEN